MRRDEKAVRDGITRRVYRRRDGSVRETFTLRWEEDGVRRRRTFDSVADALDFQAKRRSDKRWRPDELRRERKGRQTLGEYFADWWVDYAMVDLSRRTLATYRCLWEAHAEPRLALEPMGEIDARRVVKFRGELIAAGVGVHSIVKTMSMLQRVFRDALEAGDVTSNPFRVVQKPSPGPSPEVRPLTPLQVERLAHDIETRGYAMGAMLVRLMAYSGLRPQEALGLHWYGVGRQALLIEHANADGELQPLKNRKRARKRSRTVDLLGPLRDDLRVWRARHGQVEADDALVLPHEVHGGPWRDEHYRTWRRRIYVPSAENVGLEASTPYDLRHTWVSLMIAEGRLSIAELAEQVGDQISTVLDTYSHVMHEWRGRKGMSVESEILKARRRLR